MKTIIYNIFILIILSSCNTKSKIVANKEILLKDSLWIDSIKSSAIVSGYIGFSSKGYHIQNKSFILSDTAMSLFVNKIRQKGQKELLLRRVTRDESNEELHYTILPNKQQYSKILVEFYFPWSAALDVGGVDFIEPNKLILKINGYVLSKKIDKTEKRFMKMVFKITVPDDPSKYKVYFMPVFDNWEVYQPLVKPWKSEEGWEDEEDK